MNGLIAAWELARRLKLVEKSYALVRRAMSEAFALHTSRAAPVPVSVPASSPRPLTPSDLRDLAAAEKRRARRRAAGLENNRRRAAGIAWARASLWSLRAHAIGEFARVIGAVWG